MLPSPTFSIVRHNEIKIVRTKTNTYFDIHRLISGCHSEDSGLGTSKGDTELEA
jgi:hypothetical protein